MLRSWPTLGLATLAVAGWTAVGSAQSLTTTYANDNFDDGNMFNVIAATELTLDSLDVHFEDLINPAPACVGGGTCSVVEAEVWYKVGGHVGFDMDSTAWTLIGSVQHTVTTPPGSGQPLGGSPAGLPIDLDMDPANINGPSKYAFYVTNTGLTNSVTGLTNEALLYSGAIGVGCKTTYSNVDLTVKNGIGKEYPFSTTFAERCWNGTIHYSGGAACSSAPQAYCTAGTSASGCNASISASGTASASASSGFTVTVSGVEGAKDGIIIYGQAGKQALPWGNGTSLRCVVAPLKRGGLQAGIGTSGACDGSFSQDLNARWCPTCPKPGHNPTVGKMQISCWYRDPFNTSNQTTSFSNAVEVDVCP